MIKLQTSRCTLGTERTLGRTTSRSRPGVKRPAHCSVSVSATHRACRQVGANSRQTNSRRKSKRTRNLVKEGRGCNSRSPFRDSMRQSVSSGVFDPDSCRVFGLGIRVDCDVRRHKVSGRANSGPAFSARFPASPPLPRKTIGLIANSNLTVRLGRDQAILIQ
jgi:hypothetical protein